MFPRKALLALVGAATMSARAAPAPVTDTSVLQFALTLEQLENAFYDGALGTYDADAFEQAGYEPWVRGRFEQIAKHEADHVAFITGALGNAAPAPCNYSFPYTDPKSFVALSMAIEGVGAGAYLGASRFISDKDTLTAAAAILAVESRQAGWVSSAVLKEQPWDGDFETPLGFSGAYSLAAQFITSCPSTNPPLPVTPFPALTVAPSTSPDTGSTVSLTFNNPNATGPLYAAWYDGLQVVYTDVDMGSNSTTVPDGLHGTVYVGIVSDKQAGPTNDADMVTGLAIAQFPFSSTAQEDS
ncbi:hypothetical protein CERSUDRAFT_123805 [Gelatoporia subvermispora B]|uniref:Ferritin-like domain-containing protein n=1 Tax=Ceriporiopsis subvermispora (strain B) TaxID=914234 RepID=M2RD49_CERS8|nr:hypothetical protein CERSUDRAFT_123805 [Gelatoporia subvermispora B]